MGGIGIRGAHQTFTRSFDMNQEAKSHICIYIERGDNAVESRAACCPRVLGALLAWFYGVLLQYHANYDTGYKSVCP